MKSRSAWKASKRRAGLHHIEWKQVDPPWYVPNKAWAGSLAGTVVPPGPADPLKARFMSFEGGAGIHGIDPSEYSSIGHDASHGCVRMRIPDVIALYEQNAGRDARLHHLGAARRRGRAAASLGRLAGSRGIPGSGWRSPRICTAM